MRPDPAGPLPRRSTEDVLVAALRRRILDGELGGGERLPELTVAESYGVARHTVRAALRRLDGEGLVRVESRRGAAVAELSGADVRDLHELRMLLEVGAVELALRRRGRLPDAVHAAAAAFGATCRTSPAPAWHVVVQGHTDVHAALVATAGSKRIAAAHAALATELALFLVQGRPLFDLEALAAGHLALVAAIEHDGPNALARHLEASATALGGVSVTRRPAVRTRQRS